MNDDFARRMHEDVDAAGEDILRVSQRKRRGAAAEELLEGLGKIAVDTVKALNEHFLHLLGESRNQAFDLLLGLLDIRELDAHKFVPFGDLFIFLDCADIDVAQRLDALF